MAVADGWATNGNVRLHVLDSVDGSDPHLVPLVSIPGACAMAEDYRGQVEALAPRRCVVMSLRGRGRSDAPTGGYSLEDHVADVEAVVRSVGIGRFCLEAYSRGVAYAAAFAARHPGMLEGLILEDYPAVHTELPPDWADRVWSTSPNEVPLPERMPRHAVEALQRESRYLPLWEGLRGVGCPTLVVRGGADGSLLPPGEAARYLRILPNGREVVFEDSGHDLIGRDRDRYLATLRGFLEDLDAANR